jgi:hypothetical protein
MKNKKNNLQSFVKCSACGYDFKQESLMILEENQQQSIFHAACPNCQTATMIFLASTHSGLVSLGMATDLDRAEAKKFFGQEAVNVDEVIDVHSCLFQDNKK